MADLDRIDFQILKTLVGDGRISFTRLGEGVGLSAHGAADRVRRLQAAGVIAGFSVQLDLGHVGRGLDAFIDIRLLSSVDPDDFERGMRELPAVRECVFVTGRFDYQVRVACKDTDDLDQTVRALRRSGAAQTETRIAMRTSRPPLSAALDG